jgi:hypothetical protein
MEYFVYAFSALLCSQRTREENNAPGACSYLEKRDFNARSFSIIFVRSDVCQYFHQLVSFSRYESAASRKWLSVNTL